MNPTGTGNGERGTAARTAPFPVPRSPLPAVFVALVAVLVYANALANGFVLDDHGVIQHNPLVHSASGFWRAWVSPYWPPPNPGGQYRPLALVSFTLDWLLSGGDPRWMHAVNLLWHAAAAVAVWLLAAELLAPAAALAAALAFAVHPVHVEAVSNLVGRLEPMAAFFVVVALLAHRRASWWAPACFALALLCKENAIVFLALAVGHDLLLGNGEHGNGERTATKSSVPRSPFPVPIALRERRSLYAAYGVVTLAYALTLVGLFHDRSFHLPAPTFVGASTAQRLLTAATVVPHYVRLLLAPLHLSADYYPQVISLATGVTPAALLGVILALVLGLAVRRAWRPAPELAFALLWIVIALAPVSNILVPVVPLAERTLYLPSVGACLALGWAFHRLTRAAGERSGAAAPRAHAPALAAAAVVLLLGAARTWTRTPVWRDDKRYILTLLRDHPESYRAHLVAARVLATRGDWAGATQHYEAARRLFGLDAAVYYEPAAVAATVGDLPRAEALLDSARAVAPALPAVHLTQADVRFARGNYAGAIAAARRALALAPDSTRAVIIIGAAASRLGDRETAETAFRDGVRRHPGAWELRVGYAETILARGDGAAALAEARRAVALSGGEPLTLALRERAEGGARD